MKKIVFFVFLLCSMVAYAQDTVSLVVSADGATKTQAIDNALRLAIEQTYGTFVSANTEILNDQLVKDEIATVSSGNIQKYTELACVTLPNGNISVTLNVTVSLNKLISYAQSKGSECELAGASFGANIRLYEFNKKNEQIVIQNMIRQLDALRPVYDLDIEVSNPVLNDDGKTALLIISVLYKFNERTKNFCDIIRNTVSSLAMTKEQIQPMEEMGLKFYRYKYRKEDHYHCSGSVEYDRYFYDVHCLDTLVYFIYETFYDCSISDNTNSVYFFLDKMYPSPYYDAFNVLDFPNGSSWLFKKDIDYIIPLQDLYKINKLNIQETKDSSSFAYFYTRDYYELSNKIVEICISNFSFTKEALDTIIVRDDFGNIQKYDGGDVKIKYDYLIPVHEYGKKYINNAIIVDFWQWSDGYFSLRINSDEYSIDKIISEIKQFKQSQSSIK